ncbi:MAG: FAD-binding domain-containing protein [Chakrabartia sp.]
MPLEPIPASAAPSQAFPLPSRAAGLARLAEFLPRAGQDYAETRNYDLGPDAHQNVSGLSAYLRHRLLTEEEVVGAVLARHGPDAAEKFVQEVLWRTYWKGWLEQRPTLWTDWQAACAGLATSGLDLAAAEQGRTGINCFDHWARELVETGYLHNHARMWFASLWIFTLRLPWQLGAAFFLRHLLDGDPASNTLSWRWVAGLHTPGKTYLATPDNIATFTKGRFQPGSITHGPAPDFTPHPPVQALPEIDSAPNAPALLLMTQDDLHAESLDLARGQVAAIAALPVLEEGISKKVYDFRAAALAEGCARAAAHFGAPILSVVNSDLLAAAAQLRVRHIVTAYAPTGPVAARLAALRQICAAAGVRLHLLQRPWDSRAWPLATKGFFAFRQHIPMLIGHLDKGDGGA